MPFGVSVILGNNGYVWLSPTSQDTYETSGGAAGGGFAQNLDVVPSADRQAVSRLRNCVTSLAAKDVMLWDTSLTYAYEASLKFQASEMLRPDVMAEVASLTKDQIKLEMMEH